MTRTRRLANTLALILLIVTAVCGPAVGQVVEVQAPPADARVTLPRIVEWLPGKAVDVRAAGGPVTWCVLSPETLDNAWAVDDNTLRVVMPLVPVRILLDFGQRSQLLVIKPRGGPGPGPDDPVVPPLVIPPGWEGFTETVYRSAKAAKLATAAAAAYAKTFKAGLAAIDSGAAQTVQSAYAAVNVAATPLAQADAATRAVAAVIEEHSSRLWDAGKMRAVGDARAAFGAVVEGLELIAAGK